ncbi:hypothetical protein QE381_000972 [Microbacterium sp. SORGH_AS 888]|nr:hypothetical protein [Microbacterium sp. SORGH_AS_0888]
MKTRAPFVALGTTADRNGGLPPLAVTAVVTGA